VSVCCGDFMTGAELRMLRLWSGEGKGKASDQSSGSFASVRTHAVRDWSTAEC
jgi:hypothetical protein